MVHGQGVVVHGSGVGVHGGWVVSPGKLGGPLRSKDPVMCASSAVVICKQQRVRQHDGKCLACEENACGFLWLDALQLLPHQAPAARAAQQWRCSAWRLPQWQQALSRHIYSAALGMQPAASAPQPPASLNQSAYRCTSLIMGISAPCRLIRLTWHIWHMLGCPCVPDITSPDICGPESI